MSELPAEIESWIGETRYEQVGEFDVERGYIFASCASVENGNPLFWNEKAARDLTDGWIAPPTMLSVWFRPHYWAPDRTETVQPLQVHFDLKERLGLPEAVMTDNTIVFGAPVRPGDRLKTWQVLRSVSAVKRTKLGEGRFWAIDVEYENQGGEWVGTESYTGFGYQGDASDVERRAQPSQRQRSAGVEVGPRADFALSSSEGERSQKDVLTTEAIRVGDELPQLAVDVSATTVVLGALAARDWRPMHHDTHFAVHRNGVKNIFLNTPNQAAWFERYLTDWTGPEGRLGRIRFRMRDSVFPDDRMVFRGIVEKAETDASGCSWAEVEMKLAVGDNVATECTARIAIPTRPGDNPWKRRGEQWNP